MTSPRLSTIIPLRADDFAFYRARLDLRRHYDMRDVETLLVDDGSPQAIAPEIQAYAETAGWRYVRIDSAHLPFSLARARNRGLEAAHGEWVSMEDADVIYTADFYQRMLSEVALLDSTPFNFLTIPVLYVAEEPSAAIMQAEKVDAFVPQLLTSLLMENPMGSETNRLVQHFAPASAMLIARRKLFFMVGAYDESFVGWGGEDRDLIFRLLRANSRLDKPQAFAHTKTWNLNDTVAYEGWRAVYRLHGDYLAMKGIYGFHLYHEQLPWRQQALNKHANLSMANEKAKLVDARNILVPRPMPDQQPDIIIGRNPYLLNDQVLSALSNPLMIDEVASEDTEKTADYISSFNPASILFWNPYGSPWRQSLYQCLVERGHQPIVAERGALPSSIYFDQNGFCATSSSYQEPHWNQPLDAQERQRTEAYIADLRFGADTLEQQSNRLGVGLLRLQLKIPHDKKILFVPLQLADDTVTTLFSERHRSYSDYLGELQKLCFRLPRDWVVLYKHHPLAVQRPVLNGAIEVNDYHIHDLLEAADATALFNSGTGVLAMAFETPVFYYGPCFYAFEGINQPFRDAEQLTDALSHLITVDREKVVRFYHYLTQRFYSTATWQATAHKKTEISVRSRVTDLSYSILRIPGRAEHCFSEQPHTLRRSILFDRFRNHDYQRRQKKPAASPQRPLQQTDTPKPYAESDRAIRKCMHYKLYKLLARPLMSAQHARKLRQTPTLFFLHAKKGYTRRLAQRLLSPALLQAESL